jgi:hypothetical protein
MQQALKTDQEVLPQQQILLQQKMLQRSDEKR